MNAVSGAASCADRFRLQNASFQHRMIDSSAVEAMPGKPSGSNTCTIESQTPQPSMRLASMIAFGVSRKKVNSIQTPIGRLLST